MTIFFPFHLKLVHMHIASMRRSHSEHIWMLPRTRCLWILWICLWINLISYACAVDAVPPRQSIFKSEFFVCYALLDWWYCRAARVLHLVYFMHIQHFSLICIRRNDTNEKKCQKNTRDLILSLLCVSACHGADRIADEDDPTVFFLFGCCCGCLFSDDAHKRTLSKVCVCASCMAFTCLNQYFWMENLEKRVK